MTERKIRSKRNNKHSELITKNESDKAKIIQTKIELCEKPIRHTKKWYIDNWGVNPLKQKLPFEEFPNPHYKKSAPMKLWDEKDVLPFRTEEGIEAHKIRVAGAEKAVETRRERLLTKVETWKIELKKEPFDKVTKKAIDAYNLRQACRKLKYESEYSWASIDSDRLFLRRIITNYLRHQLSSYEANLNAIYGKTGTSEAYLIIRKKIDEKIIEVYPELDSL